MMPEAQLPRRGLRRAPIHPSNDTEEGNFRSMISFTVRMTFSPDDRDEVAEILRALTHESRQEPGCVTYVPHHLDGDRDTILIYEQYRDADAAEAHRQFPHFKQYAVGGLYQKMKDRVREDLVALA
jgi:quinol monooxygenase YgiN